jgi:thiosulfate dehydrogenase
MKIIFLFFLIILNLLAQKISFGYPAGKLGETIKTGEDIVNHTNTNPLSKKYVNSKLQCVNCHRKGKDGKAGTTNKIGTFIGTATAFPAYSKRYDDIISLQNRIDGCFQRCLGGNKSVVNTKTGIAVESYITWLSTGLKINMSPKAPRTPSKIKMWNTNRKKFGSLFKKVTHKNYINGKKLYNQKCASCHEINGEETENYPPLWGKDKNGNWLSYTADGSMAKLPNGATWIQDNMPLNNPGSLTDKEVVDITLYINAQERASYKGFKVENNFEKLGLNLKNIVSGNTTTEDLKNSKSKP